MTKQFTNAQLISIMNALGGGNGRAALTAKKMPMKILYAIHRSTPNISAAYKAYEETLDDICGQYGATKDKLKLEDNDKQREMDEHIADLLNTKVDVDIHCIDEDVLENYDDRRFDPLTYAEIDILYLTLLNPDSTAEE